MSQDYVAKACKGCRGAIRGPHHSSWEYVNHAGYVKWMLHFVRMGYFILDSVCPMCEYKSRRLPKMGGA